MTLTLLVVFVVALLVIAGGAWAVRRFAGNRLGANANRGRLPRLAVIDAAAVDGRRKLVLVRRDNVEHLIMIGGPSDVVIEPNIVRAMPQRDPSAVRGPVGADLPPRVPLPEADRWADTPAEAPEFNEPVLPDLPPARPSRPMFGDEARRPAAAERRSDPLAGLTPEPALRPEPPPRPRPIPRSERSEPVLPRSERTEALAPAPRSEPRPEPVMPRTTPTAPTDAPKAPPPLRAPERPAAPAPAPAATTDQNLAEMAQRLEAALRRPAGEPDRAPPVAPETPPRAAPLRGPAEPPPAPAPAAANAAPPVPPPAPKISLDNLEDEMASLLGRPKTPT